ncbi:helix-turn-helix domain-containing protein [Kitasatospora sp. NPDC094011]|uniref:helix-turn-helix domain-containing protein n=1 Tax=Kitasatospora sp. NPDC094011 TaxID=3364090 RepID=UPI0037FA6287
MTRQFRAHRGDGRAPVGRRQRSLDPDAGPVAEFAHRLREVRERAGNPTFATMSRRVHRSTTVLSEAAGGVDLPTWATVEAFVEACGESGAGPWRRDWERARDSLGGEPAAADGAPAPIAAHALPTPNGPFEPPSSEPLSSEPPSSEPPSSEAPLPPGLPWPARLGRRWWSSRVGTAGAALALGLAVGLLTGRQLPHGPAVADSSADPRADSRALPTVVVVPLAVPPPWPAGGSGCEARTHWVYQYDHSYRGQVYALLARPGDGAADTGVTLVWGSWRWQHPVTVHPGVPAQGVGGTLLLYTKLDAGLRDPLVTVDTAEPVCAAFGTAGPTSVAPVTTVDANQGWTGAEPTADATP